MAHLNPWRLTTELRHRWLVAQRRSEEAGWHMHGLETAWELGARLFDTADVYGHGTSERLIGALASQVPRREIVLSSKVGYFAGTAPHGFAPTHMRHQLEQTLENLGTDRLDIYSLHHPDFGPQDRYLEPALEAMHAFKREGLITAIGMRGPHRYALERVRHTGEQMPDKVERFQCLFGLVQPDVLSVRDNLLSPPERSEGVFAFAAEHGVGVLVTKPLGQGLLTGKYTAQAPTTFGDGDHRALKPWFRPTAIAELEKGLAELRTLVGDTDDDLIRLALWSCLDRSEHAIPWWASHPPSRSARTSSALPDRDPQHTSSPRHGQS